MAQLTVDVGIRRTPNNVDVEVILLQRSKDEFKIREDESRPVRSIPRDGIKVRNVRGLYATLSMTERRAVNLNLI